MVEAGYTVGCSSNETSQRACFTLMIGISPGVVGGWRAAVGPAVPEPRHHRRQRSLLVTKGARTRVPHEWETHMGTSRPADDITPTDPFAPRARRERLRENAPVVAVVAVGGVVGACARYGAGLRWPTAAEAFPWTTLAVNVTGCAVMGIFMVLITEVWSAHRLLRPFFGTGVLGGYTTFSTSIADIQHLVETGHAARGLAYLSLTLIAALTATWTMAALTHRIFTRRTR